MTFQPASAGRLGAPKLYHCGVDGDEEVLARGSESKAVFADTARDRPR